MSGFNKVTQAYKQAIQTDVSKESYIERQTDNNLVEKPDTLKLANQDNYQDVFQDENIDELADNLKVIPEEKLLNKKIDKKQEDLEIKLIISKFKDWKFLTLTGDVVKNVNTRLTPSTKKELDTFINQLNNKLGISIITKEFIFEESLKLYFEYIKNKIKLN
jgi:hypothetical protein